MTGTGFMKCIPMKLEGFVTTEASLVREILDVFEAKIISSVKFSEQIIASSSLKMRDFKAKFSFTASIIN